MIRTEITVVVALFAAGLGAGLIASFLLALGRGSRVARAVSDGLAPLMAGAVFFFALKGAADGIFRLYSVLSFLLGVGAAHRIAKKAAPLFLRVVERLKVPIKSLENKVSEHLDRRFAPLREKRAAKRILRAEKRTALLAEREKKRAQKRAESAKGELKRSGKRSRGGKRKRCPAGHVSTDQAVWYS